MTYRGPVGFQQRLRAVAEAAGDRGLGAVLITPGADLRYLTGYDAKALERLTCLVVRPDAEPVLVVPGLEAPAALASPVADLGIEVLGWSETQDAVTITADLIGPVSLVAVDDHMWAEKALRFRAAMPGSEQVAAGQLMNDLRMRKDAEEIEALAQAGAAIDLVHARVPGMLRAGRSEREIGREIHDAIIDVGHDSVDFVIVASGPNGASPHHEVSDRILQPGDQVVVDIGGTMPSGYCSDCTRMYSLGEPSARYREMYAALEQAQAAAVAAVRPGLTCEELDAVGRDLLTAAGIGEFFIHRTGHGIGMSTHEEPYIVEGNARPLEPGMAFSIEPGFYVPGTFGARIEDIVVCGQSSAISMNSRPHELIVV